MAGVDIVITSAGVAAVGGLLLMGGGCCPATAIESLAASAALISFIGIFGGFMVIGRMTDMFKHPTDPKENPHLIGIPTAAFPASHESLVLELCVDSQLLDLEMLLV